jgi:hypothetical protein
MALAGVLAHQHDPAAATLNLLKLARLPRTGQISLRPTGRHRAAHLDDLAACTPASLLPSSTIAKSSTTHLCIKMIKAHSAQDQKSH